jgi:tetratricopeptide (TPR) repeat protein
MTTRERRDQRPAALLAAALAALLAMPALLATLLVAAPAPAAAQPRRTPLGDYVRAARMIRDWRYDEARALIRTLEAEAPGTPETRYLGAELAFVSGEYERVLTLLDGIDDQAASGNVGELRRLAASTLGVTRAFVSRESSGGHFVIWHAPGKDEVIAELAGDVLEAAYRALGEDFGYYPPEPIRVELLSRPADLARLSPLTEAEIETTGTIALCKYGKLMVVSPRATVFGYPWMDTLVHEYVHYVISRLSHDTVPVWLHEGLARFQQTRWRKDPDGTLSAMDAHLLATALKQRKLISFDDMHPSMAKLPSQQAAALAFAEVFTMITYVHEQTGYEGIRRIIALQRQGKSARRAVAEVLNRPWSQVEQDWKTYLRKRNLKPHRTLASRAQSRRIRFDKGGEHDENVGLDEVAGEKAQKHARLGGMLRARGMSAAAAVQYEKALAVTGPGDPFLSAKLSRTYLELGKHEQAIALARPVHEADENDAGTAVTLGLAYLATGAMDLARAAFEAALRISPFDPTVRCSLAELYQAGDLADLARREQAACTRLRE